MPANSMAVGQVTCELARRGVPSLGCRSFTKKTVDSTEDLPAIFLHEGRQP